MCGKMLSEVSCKDADPWYVVLDCGDFDYPISEAFETQVAAGMCRDIIQPRCKFELKIVSDKKIRWMLCDLIPDFIFVYRGISQPQ